MEKIRRQLFRNTLFKTYYYSYYLRALKQFIREQRKMSQEDRVERKILKISFIFVFFITLFASCKKNDSPSPEPVPEAYSFFVAGHTYGTPGTDNSGLYPPFQDKFNLINDHLTDLGVLTGDIVPAGTEKNWNEVDSVLKFLNCKVYFAVGNHDMKNRPLFESRYGKTYFGFIHKDDLFIVLDPNIDHWNISGEQLSFLKNIIDTSGYKARNIFVFFHQLLWWDKTNKYRNVRLNSHEDRADTINFLTEVEPLFQNLQNKVYMFAGDIGAASWSDDFMYDQFDNITLVASGMGEGKGDNFVFVDVDETGKVSFELIALNGDDIHALGNLEDYILP